MSKKVAVLFSGGLDSTYLVWKNLTDGNEVLPIYIEIENNKTKTILEKNRTKLLVEEFRKDKDFENKIRDVKCILKVNVEANEDSLYFKQLPIWMFGMIFSQSMDVDEIQIGYVCNDDAISYLEDIQNIYKSYQNVCEPMKPLVFPSTKMKKQQMAHKLPKLYRDLIFSCENATIIGSQDAEIINYEPCCECVPCKNIIASNYYDLGEYPEIYKKRLINLHVLALLNEGFKILDKDGNNFQCLDKFEYKKEPYQLELFSNGSDADIVEENSSNLEKVPFNG
jgi:7-cyano-7-deazaguanine synthase in queuosine biosynthesis